MIKYDAGPAPEFFSTDRAYEAYRKAQESFSTLTKTEFGSRSDFQRFVTLFVRAARDEWSRRGINKCVYCEQLSSNLVVDHFRPKLAYTERSESSHSAPYWWLAFEWSNFLPSCVECNNLKGQKFPVNGPRLKFGDLLEVEDALLLNPVKDELAERFVFLDDGRVAGLDERAIATIDVLGLNRLSLVSMRKADWSNTSMIISALGEGSLSLKGIRLISAQCGDANPFSAMRRQIFNSWVAQQTGKDPGFSKRINKALGSYDPGEAISPIYSDEAMHKISSSLNDQTVAFESFSVEGELPPLQLYQKTQYIERVEVFNIRTIEGLDVSLKSSSDVSGSWFMFLGENGTGKSTLLQVIACALIGQAGVEELNVSADSLLRSGTKNGIVRVYLTGLSKPITITIQREENKINVDPPEPKVMVLAYGSIRVFDENYHKNKESQFRERSKVRNLFNHLHTLDAGNPWLNKAPEEEFRSVAEILTSLLPRPDGAKIIRKNGEILIDSLNDVGRLSSISSGYRAIIALALDIIGVLRRGGWADISQAEGIVLIDEIDAHLHPRWKMRIVQRLREVFPRIQFIATSHDPLTLKGLDADEIAVLSRSIDGNVSVLDFSDEELPSPRHMRVDQILSSEYFGLNTTEDLETDLAFETYYKLLGRSERTVDENKELDMLRRQLEVGKKFGVTPREQLVFEAADQYIASRKGERQLLSGNERKKALQKMQELWRKLPKQDSDSEKFEEVGSD